MRIFARRRYDTYILYFVFPIYVHIHSPMKFVRMKSSNEKKSVIVIEPFLPKWKRV